MKFNILSVVLWLKNGHKRELKFEPNKINLITGRSNTGKSAILEIIDYCLFASKSKISESIINENVSWYGLKISINDKTYTLARKSLVERQVSKEYYFSSIGEIPETVHSNNSENNIKSIIETEFNINKSVSFPLGYGSNNIKVGSKISLRFFLMFNTISQNIITNSTETFFDKQNEARYRDALPRIFDIATGIEKIENILKKEKKAELEKNIVKLNKKKTAVSEKSKYFEKEIKSIIRKAREFDLIKTNTDEVNSLSELNKIVEDIKVETDFSSKSEKLEKEKNILKRKIKNLKSFIAEYDYFKKNLIEIEDSLKPINHLKEKEDLIKTPYFDLIINQLSDELSKVKSARKQKTPINKQVLDEISELSNKLEVIDKQLELFPKKDKDFKNLKRKYLFLGELKAKLNLYTRTKASPLTTINEDINKLEEDISKIQVYDTDEKRQLTIKLIEEVIQDYMIVIGDSLENYKDYLPLFDYKNKALLLRKPKTTVAENVGSSSNHMFLHLFFTLAMHEVVYRNESPYIAPFIVIDQPSRPYYGQDGQRLKNKKQSDDYKITQAFKLLDKFIEDRKANKAGFQIIVFEHIPIEDLKDIKNIHLVDKEFEDGNALIPSWLI